MTEQTVPSSEVGVVAENPMLVKFASVVSTLEEALNAIPKLAKTETERMILADFVSGLKAVVSADNRLKALGQAFDLYETDSNAEDVARIEASITSAKTALTAAGFAEDSEIVKGAIKGLQAELVKANGKVVDNLPAVAEFLGVKLGKTIRTTTEANGAFKMAKIDLQALKENDWLYKEASSSGIVVHSMSVSEAELLKLKITPASDTWIVFSYNGELQFERTKTDNLQMVAKVTSLPESWLSAKPMTCTLESLSGFTGKVASMFGRTYNNNGWSGMAILAEKFDKVQRVVKQA